MTTVLLFFACLLTSFASIFASGAFLQPRKVDYCDAHKAYSILKGLPRGTPFCSSLLYPHGLPTKTKTTTTTATSKQCTTETRTRTVHGTFTNTEYMYFTLPYVTFTEYSSTVLIPSGPSPIVDKRAPLTPANQPTNPTPTALSTCPADAISCACTSLVPRSTTTTTTTLTKKVKCTTTTKATTTLVDHETTITRPLTVSPPPIILSSPGTLTTTVPAACAGSSYDPPPSIPAGALITIATYPDFPQTTVECCLVCARTLNCIASAYIESGGECQLLINGVKHAGGKAALCPLGAADLVFGKPDMAGDVFPGPCGR